MLSIHFHNDLIWHLYTNSNDAGMTINIHKPYSIFWMAHLGFWPQGPWRSLTEFTKHGDSNGDSNGGWSNKRFATDMQCRVIFLGSDSNGLLFLKHLMFRLSGHLFRIWQQWFGFFETCLTCKKVTGRDFSDMYHGHGTKRVPHNTMGLSENRVSPIPMNYGFSHKK